MNIQEKRKREYFARINQVMDYIDQHLEQALELKDIASIANYSPFHFHRIFTFLIGETPFNYIQCLRLERAAIKLLQDPLLPITEVAYSCGFGSISLFSRTFKKYYGITPTQFTQSEKPIFLYTKGSYLARMDKCSARI